MLKSLFKILGICFLFSSTGLALPSVQASAIYTVNPFSSVDQNGLSPFWDWKTIESENFRLTFPSELETIAQRTVQYLEEAHRILSPLLLWKPEYKPQVLLIDNSDEANGMAAPIARFGIVLWSTPPENWYGTSYYDDWLRFLVVHEYTHFLNMDATASFWKPLRYVFGDALLPNSIWPAWMLEGLAVYMETRFTQAGRGRSPYYEMVLRSAVEEEVLDTSKFVTLDKVNGTNPYFPGGDTRYQFGYHLMNQIASQHGDETLGLMSERSSKRIPFFINDNLKTITGKDWADFWNDWIVQTRSRVQAELQKIQTQPLSTYTSITENSHEISNRVTGSAVSPDGKWIAYTLASSDQREGLYLRELETGNTQRLNDKNSGIGLKFTPDSKFLICSESRRKNQFNLFSDLEIYDLEKNSRKWLTDELRARDPDISPDGKWVVFSQTGHGVTGLALAPLNYNSDGYELGEIQKRFTPPLYDIASNPRFSPDGTRVYFSLHPNGKSQEDLMEWDFNSEKITVLVSDGFYNRYPTFDSQGRLYFISNGTGVDNLYRYHAPSRTGLMVSNVKSGINFPTFPSHGDSTHFYASLFSTSGWNLAKFKLLDQPIPKNSVTLERPPAPKKEKGTTQDNPAKAEPPYVVQDYSAFPTLLPRIWSPLVGFDSTGVSLGAELFGFDAVNRHRYLLAAAYQTGLGTLDAYGLYSNRSLGPAWNLVGNLQTTSLTQNLGSFSYSRQLNVGTSVSYPFLYTYSSLTPSIGLNFEKIDHYRQANLPDQESFGNIDGLLSFSNLEYSNLSISPEGGRLTQFGSRYSFNGRESVWKFLLLEQENFRISPHSVLSPSLKAMWSSHLSSELPSTAASLQGRNSQQLLGAFSRDSLDRLSIRGYPGRLYFSRAATVTAIDFRFPIARIFRGWGTQPFFLDNLYGLAFIEGSYFPYSGTLLPSAGSGLRLSTEIFFLPITFSAEYHHGFQRNKGGAGDLFFQILANGISF
jgi:Tol biopolymer transport system component